MSAGYLTTAAATGVVVGTGPGNGTNVPAPGSSGNATAGDVNGTTTGTASTNDL
jgi:hypothetical protein